jgi:hypothetical protein
MLPWLLSKTCPLSEFGTRIAIGAYLNYGNGTFPNFGHVRIYDLADCIGRMEESRKRHCDAETMS